MISEEIRTALQTAVVDAFAHHITKIKVNAIRHAYFGGFYENPIENFSVSEDFTRAVAGANKIELDFVGAVGRFAGGVLLPNGKVFCVPFNSAQHLTIDPDNHSLALAGNFSGVEKWMGATLASNARVYCAPYNSATILEHTPGGSDTVFSTGVTGVAKWSGFVASPTNGSLYAIPFNQPTVMRVIPTTRAVSFISITGNGTSLLGKWRGGCYVPSQQLIYCAPFNHPGVLTINPAAGTSQVITPFPELPQGAFSACLLWRDGNIYLIPYNADAVYVLNPTTNQVTKFGKFPVGGQKWMGARVAPNGNIYCIPYNHPSILEIDPVNQSVRFIGNFEGTNKWMGGTLTQYGNLVAIPYSADDALSILGTRMSGPDWWNISSYTNIF